MSIAVNYAVLAKGWERFTIMHKDRKASKYRDTNYFMPALLQSEAQLWGYVSIIHAFQAS